MPNPYREIFAVSGTLNFTLAGFVSRLPLSMTGIGLITMLSQLRDHYGLAGAVTATYTLSMAFISPQVSRLVDRFGQRRVLLPTMAISAASLSGLLLCAHFAAPAWTLFAFALPAGLMPMMGAMTRARWTELYRSSPRLNTAYSLEGVIDELTYIVGPAVSVLLCTTIFPESGPLTAIVLLVVGVVWFAMQHRTQPAVRPRPGDGGRSAIRVPSLRVLVLVLVTASMVVGTVDVVSVAFARQQGVAAATGVVMAAYALGSGISGLAFGAWKPRIPPIRLLTAGVAGMAVTTVPLLLAGDIATLSVAVFFGGVFFAPTLIVIMGLVERLVPDNVLTEGLTWTSTGVSIGIAAGSALSGFVVDRFGPTAGFTVAIAGGVAALAIVAVAGSMLAKAAGSPVAPVSADATTAG